MQSKGGKIFEERFQDEEMKKNGKLIMFFIYVHFVEFPRLLRRLSCVARCFSRRFEIGMFTRALPCCCSDPQGCS